MTSVLFDDQGHSLESSQATEIWARFLRMAKFPHPVWAVVAESRVVQIYGEPADYEPALARATMNPEGDLHTFVMEHDK